MPCEKRPETGPGADLLDLQSARNWAAQHLRAAADRPQVEAELLLAHLLDCTRPHLLTHLDDALAPERAAAYQALVERRAAGEPLPYLTGRAPFFGREFAVTPAVLIPRPETELLVELALDWLAQHPRARVVDVGTGSGCIAVTLARHAPEARLTATDIAADALAVARRNAQRHGVAERVDFVRADLLAPLAGADLIVSNPPYVATGEWDALPPSVRREPCGALLAGADGLDAVRRLLAQAASRMRPGGLLLVEIGAGQGDAAQALAQAAFPQAKCEVLRDLAGKDRVLRVVG